MKHSKMIYTKLAAAITVGALTLPSHAALIGSWDWASSTGFLDNGTPNEASEIPAGALLPPVFVQESAPANSVLGESTTNITGATVYEKLSWGLPAPDADGGTDKSSITIENLDSAGSGALVTNGAFQDINLFSHENNILQGGSSGSPWGTLLLGGFTIVTPGPVDFIEASMAPLTLAETTNIPLTDDQEEDGLDEDANCSGPNPNGSVCDDIFTTPVLSGEVEFYRDGDYAYFVEFQFDPQATEVFMNGPLVTIFTAEENTTTIATQARVTARKVPAPGSALLLGLGLAAVAGFRRRKASA